MLSTRFLFVVIAIATFIIIFCGKDEVNNNPENQLKTIDLKLVDINPASSCIQVISECEIEIKHEITGTFLAGPRDRPAIAYKLTIRSNNPDKLKISYGRLDKTNQIVLLEQESYINAMLIWTDEYIFQGFSEEGVFGYQTNYVGIKVINENETMYGWIHIPRLREIDKFALDTTGTATTVFAGRNIGIK